MGTTPMSFDPRVITQERTRVRAELDSRGVVPASPSVGETVATRYHQYSQPEHYQRATAFTDAVHLAAHFCVVNSITVPAFCQTSLNGGRLGTASRWNGNLFLVTIDANSCGLPRYGSRLLGSWPGAQWDDTVAGTVAHEIGHIAHWMDPTKINQQRKEIESIAARESKVVSDYERKSPDERWAEAMRLFILNPSLLERDWPRRFEYLAAKFSPVVTTHWAEILESSLDAPCAQHVAFTL